MTWPKTSRFRFVYGFHACGKLERLVWLIGGKFNRGRWTPKELCMTTQLIGVVRKGQ